MDNKTNLYLALVDKLETILHDTFTITHEVEQQKQLEINNPLEKV